MSVVLRFQNVVSLDDHVDSGHLGGDILHLGRCDIKLSVRYIGNLYIILVEKTQPVAGQPGKLFECFP